MTVKADMVSFRLLACDSDSDSNSITDHNWMVKGERLVEVNRARAGEFGAEQGRDQRGSPHAMGNDFVKHVALGKFLLIAVRQNMLGIKARRGGGAGSSGGYLH